MKGNEEAKGIMRGSKWPHFVKLEDV
jgi:hypothetical protein